MLMSPGAGGLHSEQAESGVEIKTGAGPHPPPGAGIVKPPPVSVIIPCYNYGRFLAEAIESVLSQDHPAVEVIVVDDGSTDNTREVVAGFGDRVRCIHQENAGVSAARNTGIRAASHDLIALLDADDTFLPGMLSRLAATLVRLGRDYGLVACDCLKVTSDGRLMPQKSLAPQRAADVHTCDLILRNRFVVDGVVVRRDALLRAGLFDPDLRCSEDRDLWIRLSRITRLHKVPEALVRVRIHSASASTQAANMMAHMRQVLVKAQRQGLPREGRTLWLRAHAFLHYQTAWMHRDAADYRNAVKHLLRSVALWPLFLDPHSLNENYFFRLRSLRQFLFEGLRRGFRG
jgi:glycosyltransferase involved in cell wall biosynthesis